MDIGETGLAGQVAWFRLLAETDPGRAWQVGSGLAVVTGLFSNSDNGIAVDRAGLRNEPAVRSLVGTVLEHDVPASLVVSEPATESEIRLLLELGLRPENSANEMGKALTLPPEIVPPPGVEISEVLDQELLYEGLRALGVDWFDEAERLKYLDRYSLLGYGPGQRVRHWTAIRDGQVIAMATSFRFADAVMLLHLGVVEPERRRGVATALTAARLSAALDDGVTRAVLSPTPDGYQLHRQLGFELRPVPADRWFYLPTPDG